MAAGIKPCGLGCRDTLRFEVGLPLYGDELSETITPIMAGLGIFVKLDKGGVHRQGGSCQAEGGGCAQETGRHRVTRQGDTPSWV